MNIKFKNKLLFLTLFITSLGGLFAQSFDQQYQKAIEYRLQNHFEKSDSVFKIILKKHKRNLPEDLCYHYGVVLFKLSQKDKSISFLNKYLSFTKNNYQYRDSTQHYLTLMNVKSPQPKANETAYTDTCDQCHGKGVALQNCHKCSGSGKVLCYQCKGTGLIGAYAEIGTSKFSKCSICNGAGSMVCALCKGDKTIEAKCSKCNGNGKIIIYK